MSVLEVEQYRQKNGEDVLKVLVKPTKLFPEGGYFYCDTSDEKLVKQYKWRLQSQREPYVTAGCWGYRGTQEKRFHREKAFNILSYYPNYINHINRVEYDNVNQNLDVVNQQQNCWCKSSKGYYLDERGFRPHVGVNSRIIRAKYIPTEVEACQVAYQLELKYEDYMYDFLKDRRKDADILDLERTGQISKDEAIYRHVLRYVADNA